LNWLETLSALKNTFIFLNSAKKSFLFSVKVKWGKEIYNDIDLNTDDEPVLFKAQLFALTGVQPHRQKVMIKGAVLKDESWEKVGDKVKNGATILMMGTKEEEIPKDPTAAERTQFMEDMDESQLQSALQLPAGLANLGNTCYLNATVQCFKTVPELKSALVDFKGGLGNDEKALTAALRDQYRAMDNGQTMPPIMLVQVLHNAFPRFAERGEQGGFQQQDANECWIELMGILKRNLTMKANPNDSAAAAAASSGKSVIDTYFGLQFETETKCVESDEEPVTKSTEHFLQYNCYIDKDVKYLASGLQNVSQKQPCVTCDKRDKHSYYSSYRDCKSPFQRGHPF
jgi:ubiquitin carboxyl-terminal hydrolase 14